MKLNRAERQYYHLPFWGNGGTIPQIQLGDGASWVDMSTTTGYTPPVDWSPPDGFTADTATWYMVLIAGPDATSNPGGTIVLTASATRVRTKVNAGNEIDIQPDGPDEWIHLVT